MQARNDIMLTLVLVGAGPHVATLASFLQEALLALVSEMEQGSMTIMLVPRAALVETSAAGAQLRIWGAIADKQVQC